MSENLVYKVKVDNQVYGADDKASATSLAELLGGEVFTASRKDALAHIRVITATPGYPPVLNDMLAEVKSTIISEITEHEMMIESCWRVIAQFDSKSGGWYAEVKNLADGPVVYNQRTGEKYASICHARWDHDKSCAVKYLANGINDDKFGKSKPEIVLKAEAASKTKATAALLEKLPDLPA